MARETHKEYIRRLRRERDDPLLYKKEKDLFYKDCFTYFIKNSKGESQLIPYSHIHKYDTVYMSLCPYAVLTPKEQAFLLQRRIHSNIIVTDVLQKADASQAEIQYYFEQRKKLKHELSQIIYRF